MRGIKLRFVHWDHGLPACKRIRCNYVAGWKPVVLVENLVYTLLVIFCLMTGCSSVFIDSPPADHALDDFTPPQPQHFSLKNGLEVYYLHDQELPLVRAGLYIKGGSLTEPDGLHGIADAMGELMRSGGAGARSAEELDHELERLSASVGSSVSDEFSKVGFFTLRENLEEVFSIFADVVINPRFEENRLELWKGQKIEGIRRRKDDPDQVSPIAYQQLL